MQIIHGRRACSGIAFGNILIYKKDAEFQFSTTITDVDQELRRLQQATLIAHNHLEQIYRETLNRCTPSDAAIFEMHQLLLNDTQFLSSITTHIEKEHLSAECAVQLSTNELTHHFTQQKDVQLQAKAADIRDVSGYILSALSQTSTSRKNSTSVDNILTDLLAKVSSPIIIIAQELTPSEMIQLNPNKVSGIVIINGSLYSHATILAKSMNFPLILAENIDWNKIYDGQPAILDAAAGLLYVDYDIGTEQHIRDKSANVPNFDNHTASVRKNNFTPLLYANMNNFNDLSAATQNPVQGIGLFRTEFLYMQRDNFPSEDEQYEIYCHVLKTMENKPVVIRTIDLGWDKICNYWNHEAEANPAMGLRGIRLCLAYPERFKVQLRALLRAAVYGNLSIMYPMVSSVAEVEKVHTLLSEAAQELDTRGIPYVMPRQGVMIETPAAVMICRELAALVDFFSIGTNDLTQYTLAMDRQNPLLEQLFDTKHPAILRMIQQVVTVAHEFGITVSICGEAAADIELLPVFAEMKVDILSLSPGNITSIIHLLK